MTSAREVAAFGYASMMRGKTVAIHGAGNRLLTATLACMPRSFVTGLVGRARRGGAYASRTTGPRPGYEKEVREALQP